MVKKVSPVKESLVPLIEALLFTYGEPITLVRLSKILKTDEKKIKSALGELEKEYGSDRFVILEKDAMYQLGANPKYAAYIEELVKADVREELSRAASETLAIVAYKGPLTRAETEHVRGVNSSFTMRNLLLRGLIERMENPKDARAHLYRISFDCLKYLGVKKSEELPQYVEYKAELDSLLPNTISIANDEFSGDKRIGQETH